MHELPGNRQMFYKNGIIGKITITTSQLTLGTRVEEWKQIYRMNGYYILPKTS